MSRKTGTDFFLLSFSLLRNLGLENGAGQKGNTIIWAPKDEKKARIFLSLKNGTVCTPFLKKVNLIYFFI
jgi:hypothetical protein